MKREMVHSNSKHQKSQVILETKLKMLHAEKSQSVERTQTQKKAYESVIDALRSEVQNQDSQRLKDATNQQTRCQTHRVNKRGKSEKENEAIEVRPKSRRVRQTGSGSSSDDKLTFLSKSESEEESESQRLIYLKRKIKDKQKSICKLKKENSSKQSLIENFSTQGTIEDKIKRIEAEKEKEFVEQKLEFINRDHEKELHYLKKSHQSQISEIQYRHKQEVKQLKDEVKTLKKQKQEIDVQLESCFSPDGRVRGQSPSKINGAGCVQQLTEELHTFQKSNSKLKKENKKLKEGMRLLQEDSQAVIQNFTEQIKRQSQIIKLKDKALMNFGRQPTPEQPSADTTEQLGESSIDFQNEIFYTSPDIRQSLESNKKPRFDEEQFEQRASSETKQF